MNGLTIQRHKKNRTNDIERREVKQRTTAQKTKKDQSHGPHQKKIK
jgi:hypothetical protein